ncbi:MAG: DNA polymerase III subunit alpha [Cytophagaceae bacterium]|nr:DNA polymerase III subunit alpha [Cytophagaceae bacterium]
MLLNCHSHFSLRYGTLSPAKLVGEAVKHDIEVLALTDIHNTSASFSFYNACKKNNIKPVLGIEFHEDDCLLYIGLAKNNKGFQALNHFLSQYNRSSQPLPSSAPFLADVYFIYPWKAKSIQDLNENEYLGIRIAELTRFRFSPEAKQQGRCVMLHPVTFKDKKGFNVHRLLRAIDKNTLLSKLLPHQQAQPDECILPLTELHHAYEDFPAIIETTKQLLNQCEVILDNEVKNKKCFTNSKEEDHALLEQLAMEGLAKRYPSNNKEALQRVQKELEVICRLNFNAYFLITWDILHYAKTQNFAYVGRGSGANSIVAYCLFITEVDPIKLDLYFERFLNPYRTSPPDFDLDFEHYEREKITEYIFKKHGIEHTALLATYNTFKGKSILRELGKVFGLPKQEIDAMVNDRAVLQTNNKDRDKIIDLIFTYGKELEGIPNHLSIHAGGILISEAPVNCYTATDLPPKGYPLTHFDMFEADEMGLYKYDILGQRGLGHIRDAKKIIKKNRGIEVEFDTQKAIDDELVKHALFTADTVGSFYVESPGMRMLFKKLECRDYLTLVAASSIIRPGVAQSGMMSQYIHNFRNSGKVQYLHPQIKELLQETYGIMVYQEDVIKVAHYFAGLDMGKADILRRSMSGKFKGSKGFDSIKEEFFQSCSDKGHELYIVQELWRQIESFASFSFSKAHSASFAVESYHSLYLKVHYPMEFFVAVLNNEGGFYPREYYIQQARMAGAFIHAPCVNKGDYLDTIEGKQLYVGFRYIHSLENKIGEVIAMERSVNGPYKDLYDFTKRIPASHQQLMLLIRIDAFRFTGKSKKVLLLEGFRLFSKTAHISRGMELFEPDLKELELPELKSFTYEEAYDQIELLEFPLCFPFDLLPEVYHTGVLAADQMKYLNKKVTMIGYFVTLKNSHTSKGDRMAFGHFYDRKSKTFDTVHFPPSLKRYPFKGKGFYKLTGKISEEFNYPTLEVDYMEKLPIVQKQII